MALLGTLVTILGFIVALMGLGMASSVNGRMIAALAGLAISLFGIVGMINPAYVKDAIWRK